MDVKNIELPEGTQRLVTTIKEFIMSRSFSPDGAVVRDLLMAAVQAIELQEAKITLLSEGNSGDVLKDLVGVLIEDFGRAVDEFNKKARAKADADPSLASMAVTAAVAPYQEAIASLHRSIDMKDAMIQDLKKELAGLRERGTAQSDEQKLYAEVWDKVVSIIILNSPDNRMETVFGSETLKGLGCKLVHVMRIAIEIEKKFGIEFEHEDVMAWDTVRSVVDIVMNMIPYRIEEPPATKGCADVGKSTPEA